MYSSVINYIKRRIEMSDEELEDALKYCVSKIYPKGDYIIRIGEHCRFIGFINEGLMGTLNKKYDNAFEEVTSREKLS